MEKKRRVEAVCPPRSANTLGLSKTRSLPLAIEHHALLFVELADVALLSGCSKACRVLAHSYLAQAPSVSVLSGRAKSLVMHCRKLRQLHAERALPFLAELIAQNAATLTRMERWIADDAVVCVLSRCRQLEHVETCIEEDSEQGYELLVDRLGRAGSVSSVSLCSCHNQQVLAAVKTLCGTLRFARACSCPTLALCVQAPRCAS